MAVTKLTEKIFVGDIGTAFIGTFKENGVIVDISSATVKNIVFEKPNGLKVTMPGSFVTDGTDGQLQYVSVADDLDIGGKWRLQGFVNLGGVWVGHSDIVEFKVYDNLT